MHLTVPNHNFLLVNSSTFKKYCIILAINLVLLHNCLQDLFSLCTLEKLNAGKFYKWKIKVCKDKHSVAHSVAEQRGFCFFHRIHTLKTTQYTQEKPSYFTFSVQGLLVARCFSSYKTSYISCSTKKSSFPFRISHDSQNTILFLKYFKS